MLTTYEVHLPDGTIKRCTTLEQVKEAVEEHPGATVAPVVRYTPCSEHPAYEPTNCPMCKQQQTVPPG